MCELEKNEEPLLPPVKIIGLGIKAAPLPGEYLQMVHSAEVLAGGRRQLAVFEYLHTEKIVLGAALDEAMAAIEDHRRLGRSVVVLADGDPLFFGIGSLLADRLGRSAVEIFPALSSIQEAAARLALPWAQIRPVSLHGRRDMRPLTSAVLSCDAICVLTDSLSSPDCIARFLLERGVDWFEMHVFENMGQNNEQHRQLALADAAALTFTSPNTLVLRAIGEARRPFMGIADSDFAVEAGLITKAPVRAAALGLLGVKPEDTVWDIGAGSGAVAVEASVLAARGTVFAVEKSPLRVMCIEENRRRFGAVNMEIVADSAPECLDNLPDPDCIFLGGGLGGAGRDLLEKLLDRLKPGGRLLASCVLQKSLHLTMDFFKEKKLDFEILSVQAARSAPLADDVYLAAINPVFLISARK